MVQMFLNIHLRKWFIAVIICNMLLLLMAISKQLFNIQDNVNEHSNRMYNISEFKYLISKSGCGHNRFPPYFVTLVHSSPVGFQRRAACRDTWARSDARTLVFFLLGLVQNDTLQARINEEDAQFNDIIQGNFVDSYRNMTYKHTMALKWFSENCPNAKYLLKMDDDIFANIPAIDEYLRNNAQETKYLLGNPHYRTVHRDGKWKVTVEEFSGTIYPEYVQGGTVIYSSDVVADAYEKTLTTPYFWLDDVFITGIVRSQINVSVNSIRSLRLNEDNLANILNGSITQFPNPAFLVTEHKQTYSSMIKLWEMTAQYRLEHPYKLL